MAQRGDRWIDGEGGSWLIFGIAIGGLALYAMMSRALKPTKVASTSGVGRVQLGRALGCAPCEARRAAL